MTDEYTEEDFVRDANLAEEEKRCIIALFQDKDGNWRGGIKNKVNNTMQFVRTIGPETALQELLTHDGK